MEEALDGYYLDKENEKYKKCYDTCNKCFIGGNKTNHNFLECKSNYIFYNKSKNIMNCYEICEDYYYFDEFDEFHCTKICPDEYNKKIIEKKICVNNCTNDDIYIYEYNNTCFQECPEGTISNEVSYTCINVINSTKDIKDEMDKEIENFRGMVSDFNVSENTADIIKKEKNVQYQMTTSENQKNNTNKNMTSIDLGECEDKLKAQYKIDPILPLIIFKIDYFSPDSSIPIIGYEIYHPITKEKLNLSYCEDILIKLNIPVNIDENTLNEQAIRKS